MKKYIDDILKKEYIKSNTFEYAISIFIIKKSKNELRMCVDYRVLNAFIIKNRNASFLIKNILTKLYFVKYYNKFDIITTFNEIRMRKNDKKKRRFSFDTNFSNT